MTKLLRISLFSWHTIATLCTHCPKHAPIMLKSPGDKVRLYTKIISQTKFPELIGDILACIRGCAITFYEDFITGAVTFLSLYLSFTKRKDPAACRSPYLWMLQHATFAQHLKGLFPQTC